MAAALALTILVDPFNAADVAHRPTSQWVYPGTDGKLVYKTTPAGDRIMDFSHAGYLGGGVALPNVPVIDAHGTPVTPASLYLAQLAERLGPQALKNIGY